jgi:phosphate transport system substrate-binding protein
MSPAFGQVIAKGSWPCPNESCILTGKYPFIGDLYAISLKENSKTSIEPFLEWMKGPQGQEIIEKIGYIKN